MKNKCWIKEITPYSKTCWLIDGALGIRVYIGFRKGEAINTYKKEFRGERV